MCAVNYIVTCWELLNNLFIGSHEAMPYTSTLICYPCNMQIQTQTSSLYKCWSRKDHSSRSFFRLYERQQCLTIWLPKANLTKPRKRLNPELSNEIEGCDRTQMKALDEYFLMVVFTLLLNRVMFWEKKHEKHGSERAKALFSVNQSRLSFSGTSLKRRSNSKREVPRHYSVHENRAVFPFSFSTALAF